MGSNYDWAALVQGRAGIRATANTNANFTRWMAAENPVSDWYHFNNPLNCGLNDGAGDGTGSYPDLDTAATNTARVLMQANMAPIRNALVANASLDAFSAGCAAAAWSTGGYHDRPGYIASIPLPAVVESPGSFPTPPSPSPAPIPPVPSPVKEAANVLTFDPTSEGTWALAPDGGVDTDQGAPFLGSLAGNRFNWQAVGTLAGISAVKDGNGQIGYQIAVQLPKANAQGAWFNYYVFPRNGSLA